MHHCRSYCNTWQRCGRWLTRTTLCNATLGDIDMHRALYVMFKVSPCWRMFKCVMFAVWQVIGALTMPWHLFCGLFIDRYPNLTRPLILSSPYKPILHRGHSNLRGAGGGGVGAGAVTTWWWQSTINLSGYPKFFPIWGFFKLCYVWGFK
jgi:hypothetical protein